MKYDVAIVGLGAMGSAAAWALSKRGVSVVGFDRLSPPHGMGSTHGHTRIIREAYYEHPLYVPLVRRAYELWDELEHAVGEALFMQTGGLWVGPEKGELVSGALKAARAHNVAHELLDAAAIERRFPAYRARREWVGLLEHRAGMLFPEKCVAACLAQAGKRGAELRMNEPVSAWTPSGGGAKGWTLTTPGARYEARHLIVAIGAWLPPFLKDLKVPLEIERQMSHWFEPTSRDSKFLASQTPVALFEFPNELFLTMADEGHGVKCGKHHSGLPTSPEEVQREVSSAENMEARELLDEVMPGAGGKLLDARVCLYTNTPDRHFIIDRHPENDALIVSPCSGHGFKFATAIGEIAAQMVLDGRTWIDLEPFSLSRFR